MILIHARGNGKIGIGNLSRCFELINFLAQKYEVIGIFECNADIFLRYTQNNIFRCDDFSTSLKLIAKFRPQIYICDLLDADAKFGTFLRNIGVKTIIDFNICKDFNADILIIMDDFFHTISQKCKIYKGFKYYIVPQNVVKNRNLKFSPKKQLKNILISFGGADPAFFSEFFTQKIAKNYSNLEQNFTLILGPAMNTARKNALANIKVPNLQFINSPKNLITLMQNADIFVTLGGMSAYEAMCLGLPVCAPRWSYLGFYVENFGKKNMICDLGNIENSFENLLNLDLNSVNLIAKNAFKIIGGSALSNIEKIISRIKNDKN